MRGSKRQSNVFKSERHSKEKSLLQLKIFIVSECIVLELLLP